MSSEGDLRRLREQAALSVFDSSPAILVAEQGESQEQKEVSPMDGTITPPEQNMQVDVPGHSEWELLSPSHMSQCGSSPRSVTHADSAAGLSRTDSGLGEKSSCSLPAMEIPSSAFSDSESTVEAPNAEEPQQSEAPGQERMMQADVEEGAKLDMPMAEPVEKDEPSVEKPVSAVAAAQKPELPAEAVPDHEAAVDQPAVDELAVALKAEELPKTSEAVADEAEDTEHSAPNVELGALEVLSNAPSSVRLLSGQSSYAHVDHPSRPGSDHSDNHDDDHSSHTSDWGSDNEDGRPRSEPDTEDAVHELEGLSQQGSLDSDAGSNVSDLDYLGSPDIGVCSVVTGFPMGSPFERAPSSQGPHAPPSSLAADLASLGVFSAASGPPSLASSSSSSSEEGEQDAGEAEADEAEGEDDPLEDLSRDDLEEQWARWAERAGSSGVARTLRRLGAWMKACMERAGEAIPPKLRARMQLLLRRMDAALPEGAKNYTALLGTGVAVLSVLVAWMFAKNRYLAYSLRSREDELQRQIIKILDLQAKLQGSRTIPITRHCSLTISSAF